MPPHATSDPTSGRPGTLRGTPAAKRPPTEESEVDAPSRLSIRLLGVICAATVIPWLFAKTACNRRDTVVRVPDPPALSEVVKNPKATGLEFAQRLVQEGPGAAAELAAGPLRQELLESQKACPEQPPGCGQSGKVATRSIRLRSPHGSGLVRTESHLESGEVIRYELTLASTDEGWAVTSRRAVGAEDESPPTGKSGEDAGAPTPATP